jgi:type I restriction enzyme, S subunit
MSDRARLGDHVDIVTGFPFKSANYTNDPAGIRLLRGDNIAQGTLRWDGVKRWPTGSLGEFKEFLLQRDDIVIAMDRPWIEAGLKFAYLKEEDVPSLLVQRVACLRAKPSLNQRFLSYLISSGAFTAYVLSVQTGTAVPHISAQQIADFTFAMPLKRVQDAIAEVFGAVDDKITVNERVAVTVEELATAKLSRLLSEFDHAAGWRLVRLEEIASINELAVRPKSIGHLRYIDISSVSRSRIAWPDLISWDEAPSRARRGVLR